MLGTHLFWKLCNSGIDQSFISFSTEPKIPHNFGDKHNIYLSSSQKTFVVELILITLKMCL